MTTTHLSASNVLAPQKRHHVLAEGMELSANDVAPERILTHLARGGLSEAQAVRSLAAIERHLRRKRDTFDRTRNRALVVAAFQVVLALLMVLSGIADGRVGAVALAVALGFAAYRRFDEALAQNFGDLVLTNR